MIGQICSCDILQFKENDKTEENDGEKKEQKRFTSISMKVKPSPFPTYKASPDDASESMGRGKRLMAIRATTMREMGVDAKAMYQPA